MITRKNEINTTDNSIDTFYNLITSHTNPEEAFQENLIVWKQFYDNRHYIILKNILDDRLFKIIKFLLEQEKGQIFDYFQSELLDTLISYQNQLEASVTRKELKDSETISTILKNIDCYEEICKFIENNQNIFKEDIITKNSIYKFIRTPMLTNSIISLIITIDENFFELQPELVLKTIKFIETKLMTIKPSEKIKDYLYNEMFYQYFAKIIPIKDFSNQKLKEDKIINAIITEKVSNKKIIDKLFDKLEPTSIIELFNNDIFKVINFIDNLKTINEVEKQVLINKIGNLFLTPEYFYNLLPLITNNYKNKYLSRYLTKDKIEKILNYTLGCDTSDLSFESINYMLENDFVNRLFLSNLIETLTSQQKNFPEEQRIILLKKVQEKLIKHNLIEKTNKEFDEKDIVLYEEEISLDNAIELLDNYLSKKEQLNLKQAKNIIKSIIKNFAKTIGINDLEVYFVKHQDYNGSHITDSNDNTKSINININLIEKLLDNQLVLIERIQVLITSLHELYHAKKNKDKQEQKVDVETYKMIKEDILSDYNPDYYTINYKQYQEEIEARINSYNMLAKFFETYLPNHLNKLQNSILAMLEYENSIKRDRININRINIMNKDHVDFNLAFDTLIKYIPSILEEYPILKLEYNKDGYTKSYEELLLSQNDDNKELIDNILKSRYLWKDYLEQKKNNIK